MRKATSFSTSTMVPPMPNMTAWPNWRSRVTPMITSTPGAAMPQTSAPPARNPAAVSTAANFRNAARTPASSGTLSTTPPTSVLWVTSGELILTATGKPMSRAAATASSSVAAAANGVTGNAAFFRKAIESAGVSDAG